MSKDTFKRSSKPIAVWLLVGVGMIMIQVILGGITRLTGSGLSITEWKPILGSIPPMNEQDWLAAFNKYKAIGQFKHINFDFTLQDFKFIYFWEFFHREWGRLIGIVFAIPFLIFLFQKRFQKNMIIPLIILFLLGALQSVIGWIMVQSGLNEEDIYVNHIRLAVHFISALGLLCYTFWFSLKLLVPERQLVYHPLLKKYTLAILSILILQLFYGALMAGLKAGVEAPTWPDINGNWLPVGAGRNLISDPIMVQFIHRSIAYLITVLIIVWWWKVRSTKNSQLFSKMNWLPPVFVLLQVILGIFTVLYSPKPHYLLWLGVSHQFVGMLLLMIFIVMVYLLKGKTFIPAS